MFFYVRHTHMHHNNRKFNVIPRNNNNSNNSSSYNTYDVPKNIENKHKAIYGTTETNNDNNKRKRSDEFVVVVPIVSIISYDPTSYSRHGVIHETTKRYLRKSISNGHEVSFSLGYYFKDNELKNPLHFTGISSVSILNDEVPHFFSSFLSGHLFYKLLSMFSAKPEFKNEGEKTEKWIYLSERNPLCTFTVCDYLLCYNDVQVMENVAYYNPNRKGVSIQMKETKRNVLAVEDDTVEYERLLITVKHTRSYPIGTEFTLKFHSIKYFYTGLTTRAEPRYEIELVLNSVFIKEEVRVYEEGVKPSQLTFYVQTLIENLNLLMYHGVDETDVVDVFEETKKEESNDIIIEDQDLTGSISYDDLSA